MSRFDTYALGFGTLLVGVIGGVLISASYIGVWSGAAATAQTIGSSPTQGTPSGPSYSVLYDINKDGKNTNADAKIVANVLRYPGQYAAQASSSDVTKDGKVTVADMYALRKDLAARGEKTYFDLSLDNAYNNKDVAIVASVVTSSSSEMNPYFTDLYVDGSTNIRDLYYIRSALRGYGNLYYDLNIDGKVNNLDVQVVTAAVGNVYKAMADVYTDGVVDTKDVNEIRDFLREWRSTYFDLNVDGKIDNADVKIVSTASTNYLTSYRDIYVDGVADARDVSMIREYLRLYPAVFFNIDQHAGVDANDLRMVQAAVGAGSKDLYFDLYADGVIDSRDVKMISEYMESVMPKATISSVTPTTVVEGSYITITGSRFATTTLNEVIIGSATMRASSTLGGTKIGPISIPAGAFPTGTTTNLGPTAYVHVRANGVASNNFPITIGGPSLRIVNPNKILRGKTIEVQGLGFDALRNKVVFTLKTSSSTIYSTAYLPSAKVGTIVSGITVPSTLTPGTWLVHVETPRGKTAQLPLTVTR